MRGHYEVIAGQAFDLQPELGGGGLVVEPLQSGHFDALAIAASDPLIWAGHPAKDRHDPEVFAGYIGYLLDAGGTVVVRTESDSRIIGCSRYYVPPGIPDGIGIGFTFLIRDHWGGATNLSLKRLMVGHALGHFNSVWFHIDPTNQRSQAATTRLGASHRYDARLAIGPTVAEWKCYELTADAWSEVLAVRGGA